MDNDIIDEYKIEVQKKLLEMAKYIDKICRENNIKYYLSGGSCLGAIRHQGFIPWDDDYDIMMDMENYDKFIEVCKTKLDTDKYFLQSFETEPEYHLNFIKIRDNNTTFVEDTIKDKNMNHGIYVDIFQLSGVPEGKFARTMQNLYRCGAISCYINCFNHKSAQFVFKAICKLFGKKNVLNYCRKKATQYDCKTSKDWVTIFDSYTYARGVTPAKVFGEPKYVKFEDTMLPVPEDADLYLKVKYGDYMKVPSPEEIKKFEHRPYIFDTKKSYKEYMVDGKMVKKDIK